MSLAEPASLGARADEIARPEFWQGHFPKLHINERLAGWNRQTPALTETEKNLYFARMLEEGYFQDQHEACARLAPLLAEAVATCKKLDFPPAFIFLFDEAWECFFSL